MGHPKCQLRIGNEAFIQRITRASLQANECTIIVAAPDQAVPPVAVPVFRDETKALGPLEGVRIGLRSLPDSTDKIFLTACDTPLLKSSFVQRVLDLLDSYDVAIPVVDGVPQPLSAAYRVEGLRERVMHLLATGKRSLLGLLKDANVREIAAEELREADPNLDSLRNINTPEEYDALLQDLGGVTF